MKPRRVDTTPLALRRWKVTTAGISMVIAACLGSLAPATAQTTIFQEGFNTPGDGTRYDLVRDYFDPSGANTLWTTVPNQLPGDSVIVYLEPGDQYIDGTEVPARRATFFADNDLGDNTPGIDLTDDGFALFDAAINWASGTDGSAPLKINFVIDDTSDIEINNLDITLVDRLFEQGHDVNVTNPSVPPEDDDDLIFMASHDDGSAVGGLAPEFKTTNIPLISGFFHAASQLGFGSERGENTNGTFDLQIVDGAHPLSAGFSQGIVTAVDESAARQRFTRVTRGTIAPDAKVVATLPGSIVETPEDFTNFEGEGYLRGGHATWNNAPGAGEPRAWQTLESLNTNTAENPKLVIDLAASGDLETELGPYENPNANPEDFDYVRILTDENSDGEFDVLAEFLAADEFDSDFPGFLAAADGTLLSSEFQSFTFDLPASESLDLKIEVFTNDGAELIGIDNIRVIGDAGACVTGSLGDLDGDGQVAFADFLTLSANFGTVVDSHTAGDIDCDGSVAFADFLILSANFGTAVGGVSSVPEPATPTLLYAAAAIGLLIRRRRRS